MREQERHGALDDAAIDRLRIGLLLDSSPGLIDTFATGKSLLSVVLHPDGGLVAAGATDGTVALYEAGTGRRLWEVDFSAEPRYFGTWAHAYHMAFSPDGRYLLTTNYWPLSVVVPSGKDMYRIEVASGALARPGEHIPDFLDATFSPDGRHAILRDRYRYAQVWDAEAWRPLGPRFQFDSGWPGWLLPGGAAWFATWNDGPGAVRIRDAASLRVLREIPTSGPGREVRSWSVSASGRWLALGREDGEVLVVDTTTGSVALPATSTLVARWRFQVSLLRA